MRNSKHNDLETGRILVAEPFLQDPNFRRGVVLLCDHQDDGSFGFILNKPSDMGINDLIANFPDFKSDVYYGGPVQTDTIHYLHTKGDILPNSIEVLNGVYWGGDFEVLKDFIRNDRIKSEDIRFYVGYAGWSAGQLKSEKDYHSWMTVDGHIDYVFSENKKLWKEILEKEGGTYGIIAHMQAPNLN